MTDRLPLLSAQLAFGLDAQRTGRRASVTLMFRVPSSRLSTVEVRRVVQSLVSRNPALAHRIRFSRGAAYQEWHPGECDVVELRASEGEDPSVCVTEAIDDFETALEDAAIAARLIRGPKSDTLLLVLDHALVDEQSLLLIKRQLGSPAGPDDLQLARYRAAITDRKAAEDATVKGPGITFWSDRLRAVGDIRRPAVTTIREIPVETVPGVAVPRSFRGSLFPYVLFSIHRALRDLDEPAPTVVAYPWGGRNAAYADVAGCFMNTVVSVGTPDRRSPDAPGEFVRNWYRDIDHADVPFTAVTALDSAFAGTVTAQLGYTHALETTVHIAGVPAVEVKPSAGRPPATCMFLAAATVRDEEIQLRLLLNKETTGYGADEFGSRWRHWLTTSISGAAERKSRRPDHRSLESLT